MMMMNMDDSIDTKLHNGSIIYNNNNNTHFGYYESLDNSVLVSRKRSRDNNSYSNSQTMFIGQDIMFTSQIYQQHYFEIDQFVKHHSENVRLEIEAKKRKNSRTLITALEEGLQHQLRAKEDEITKIMKLNHALEEKVKTMCIENQIWRELAQTNEATANALRNNLKYVLDYKLGGDEDAESCCESSNDISQQHDSACKTTTILNSVLTEGKMLCKKCRKEESSVLVLPCRHLCLCLGCAPSIDFCPIYMKRWEELIRENVFGLGGHRDHLPTSLADILFRYVMEHYPHLDNGIYNVVDRVMRPLALKQTRKPQSDRRKAHHSVSSTSAHHNYGSSSHQEGDDEDDGASRASTPFHTTYLNSLRPLNYQRYDIPTSSQQDDDLLFERQTVLFNQSQQIHEEVRGIFKSFGKVL
uniref:RING-type domain-containing protein n=1 Tax=Tanacetum cinerariifolium TaxID=118510 RepID=A0A6L2L478_TANCI|nr:hypothetical protein [Tanacetum cinerariifolium]